MIAAALALGSAVVVAVVALGRRRRTETILPAWEHFEALERQRQASLGWWHRHER